MTLQDAEMEVAEAETGEVPDTIFRIPVVKGKSFLEVSTRKTPEHVYREALILGFKQLLNRGQTKLTKEAFPDPEELRAKAMETAEATLDAMYQGKIRVMGGKGADGKVPREVMTEARRIARNLVKEELKRSGIKVSYVEASEITKAANALLAADPDILKQAEDELDRRKAAKVKIDIGNIPISQKKLKAAEAKKAEKVLSATKAGRVATRARPQA